MFYKQSNKILIIQIQQQQLQTYYPKLKIKKKFQSIFQRAINY